MELKETMSVKDVAKLVRLSRARFYQLAKAGVFPLPLYIVNSRRPFYNKEMVEECLAIRKSGVGRNQEHVMFYVRGGKEQGTDLYTCTGCGKDMPRSEYYFTGNKLRQPCKKCTTDLNNNVVFLENHERLKQSTKNWQTRHRLRQRCKRYEDFTESDYNELFQLQRGRCAICKRVVELEIDHDHTTGQIRGLICGNCNRGIGMFSENVTYLVNAADYLDAHNVKLQSEDTLKEQEKQCQIG